MRRIQVVLGRAQHPVGVLVFDENPLRLHSAFSYDENWIEHPSAFPLSPKMLLSSGWMSFSGSGRNVLPNPISDAAPDNWGRNVIQAALGRVPSELEYLLSANDDTRAGALRFVDENSQIRSTDTPPVPRIHSLVDLRRLNQDFETPDSDVALIARQLRGTGDSLGGTRPKSVVYDGHTLSIAKYSSVKDDLPVERMEVATLRLAKDVGLRACTSRLELENSTHPVAIIHRFDRKGSNRVPYISGRSFIDLRDDTETHYYTDLADVMRGHCGNGEQTHAELKELYRRILFTILVSNTDDHMKNHGFLWTQPGRWSLSPAFDINPQPYGSTHLKTGISELSGLQPSIQATIEVAPLFEIDEEVASTMAFELATKIHNTWRQRCAQVGMTARDILNYEPAFIHFEMKFALNLAKISVVVP
ncbi:MAG: type II toxin-antitoxin system HipA family toxin [Gammaproteobacteria bacterium]|nr:type II toxin-antitoxin system HipA family toxin [Gammaproteobacteria bacterium]